MNSRFSARFLYGTSPWNAAVLLLLLAFYAALSRWLFVAKVGSGARGVLLTGFVGLLLVGVILYYGSRQAAMSRLLDAETKHAESEKQMAYKLQGAFLQQGLPVASNLGFSATYLPATLGTLVGGDWYDAFELSRGRIMFSIGDVAGHGIEAAVTMSRARQAIIAAALLLFASYSFHPTPFLESIGQAKFFGVTWQAFAMRAAYQQVFSQLTQSSPALVVAVPAALVAYLAWPRTRYFGNHAPLLVAVIFLFLAIAMPHHPGLGFQFLLLPFLFVFIAGVSADLLETRHRNLVTACVLGLLAAQAIWNVWELARIGRG